jgi:hypothetical protein
MYDLHVMLHQFYEEHVRLGKERFVLAKHRDTNLQRLKAGLEALEYPSAFDHRNQGSYAMHTINQHPQKEYDIDVSIIFSRKDLPSSALDARKRIEEAMLEGGGNFKKPPEALTNAVRVYYAEGHHIDLAVYRRYEDYYGSEVFEHAGSDWSPRTPGEITNWFNEAVRTQSPSKEWGATVADNQMRRVVRWLKAFSKSREYWDLPGGLIISVLTSECYRPHPARDDLALSNTMVSIRDRLARDQEVKNPVDQTQTLTGRAIDLARIMRLKEKLDEALTELEPLHSPACTEQQAVDAWHWVFQHDFWNLDEDTDERSAYGERLGEAARQGNVYVTPTGKVHLERPRQQHQHAPKQRFYGEI